MSHFFSYEIKEAVKVNPDEVTKFNFYYKDNENEGDFNNATIEIDDNNFLLDIDLIEYYGVYRNARQFAERVQKVMKSGKLELHFQNGDGLGSHYGFRITPDKIEDIFLVWMSQDDIEALEGI